jgi:hypothetical protein
MNPHGFRPDWGNFTVVPEELLSETFPARLRMELCGRLRDESTGVAGQLPNRNLQIQITVGALHWFPPASEGILEVSYRSRMKLGLLTMRANG